MTATTLISSESSSSCSTKIPHNNTSSSSSSSFSSNNNNRRISNYMQDLVNHHGTSRNTLERRHIVEFEGGDDNSLFHQFARAVCCAKVIPRKELFEAWTVALHVHESFPEVPRIADLACSHGLVSWALLLLYEQQTADNNNNHSTDDVNTTTPTTTAVCIDKFMSPSAEKLRSAMLETWPHLHDRWDYVEGDIDDIIPCSSTLLVAVHACSKLSDVVIGLALHSHSPLVLVPCCHSKKCLPEEFRKHKKLDKVKIPNLTDFIDTRRVKRLQDANYKVEQVYIPLSITPKNRVLIATPPPSQPQQQQPQQQQEATEQPQKPCGTKARFYNKNFVIPIGNSSESKMMIKIIAGREAANQRKAPVPPTFVLCVILPSGGGDITVDEFRAIIPENVTVTCLQPPDKPHVDNQTGLRTRTFRITYVDLTSKQIGKECLIQLCHHISKKFPGARPRQFPR